MNIEIKEDSTYIFSFTKYENDIESNISTATISTKTPSGTEILSTTAMTISGGTATYSLDTSASDSYKIDRNFQAILTIDDNTHVRLFDIVKYPFINEVTIIDLQKENRSALELAGFKKEGEAESGTVNTALDSSFIGSETYVGGEIEIYPIDNSEITQRFDITAFNDTTGQFSFAPDRDNAVTTNRFQVRRSFAEEIEQAGDIVQSDLWKRDQRAYLILDNTQVNRMITYKFFELLFAKRRTSLNDDDRDNVQYNYYRDLYNTEYNGLPLAYDQNENGSIEDSEQSTKDSIRILR